MLRGIYGDPERYVQQYWTQVAAASTSPATAPRDADGYFWLLGRVDDVLNVAGHRIRHHGGRERAGRSSRAWPRPPWSAAPHEIKGQAIAAFVTLKEGRRAERRR